METTDFRMDELRRIAARLGDQDNMCTKDVAFHVQQRVRIYGVDDAYTEKIAWMCDGEEIDPDLWERLELADDKGEECVRIDDDTVYHLKDIERIGYVDIRETVQVFFTWEGADRYICRNKHNLTEPSIYGESFHRNLEMKTVREMLPTLLSRLEKMEKLASSARDVEPFLRDALESTRRHGGFHAEELGTKYADLLSALAALATTRE